MVLCNDKQDLKTLGQSNQRKRQKTKLTKLEMRKEMP
jgi:hypothetical protein